MAVAVFGYRVGLRQGQKSGDIIDGGTQRADPGRPDASVRCPELPVIGSTMTATYANLDHKLTGASTIPCGTMSAHQPTRPAKRSDDMPRSRYDRADGVQEHDQREND